MNTSALITFATLATFIWGGIVLIVSMALRSEGEKSRRAPSDRTGG